MQLSGSPLRLFALPGPLLGTGRALKKLYGTPLPPAPPACRWSAGTCVAVSPPGRQRARQSLKKGRPVATSTTGAYVRGHEEQLGKAAPAPVAAEEAGANDGAFSVRHTLGAYRLVPEGTN